MTETGQSTPDVVPAQRPLRWELLLLTAAGFTLVMLQWSLERGRLAFLPQYDDVGYVTEGLRLRDRIFDSGWAGIVADYHADIPHAPLFRCLSATGYFLFGMHDWSPYAACGLLVFLLIFFVDRLMLPSPWWIRLGAVAFTLLTPLSAILVTEFRPDPANALLTAIAVTLLLRTAFQRSSSELLAGLFFAMALLIKPTVFPSTIVLVAAALIIGAWYGWMRDREHWTRRRIFRRIVAVTTPAIVLAGWYFVARFDYLVHYIWVNMFGTDQHIWAVRLSLKDRLLYFTTGPGGTFALRNELWVIVAILAAGTAVVWWYRPREWMVRWTAIAAILSLAYALPTIATVKQEFFGLNFQFLLLFGSLITVREFARVQLLYFSKCAAKFCVVCVLLIAVALARFPTPWAVRGEYPQKRNQQAIDVYHQVSAYSKGRPISVLVTTGGFVNRYLMAHLAAYDNQPQITFTDALRTNNPADYSPLYDASDMVIAAGMDNTDIPQMPSAAIRDQTLSLIRARKDFHLDKRVDGPNGPYYIFARGGQN
jgi:hypothetical protein